MSGSGFEIVEEQATFLRRSLEHILQDARGTSETRGSCLHASILLSTMLTKFAGATCRVRGGGPPMDGGVLDPAGALRGHYWVEGLTCSGQFFVVDITADQFGYEDVVLLAKDEAQLRYFPGEQKLIDEHAREEQASWPMSARAPL
jgi:hypothetical protein